MDVFVVAPNLKFSCWTFPVQSSIQDVVNRFGVEQVCIYIVCVSRTHVVLPVPTLTVLANKLAKTVVQPLGEVKFLIYDDNDTVQNNQ